jgi:hypothetical protein
VRHVRRQPAVPERGVCASAFGYPADRNAYPAGKAKARGLTATPLRRRRSHRESQVAAAVGSGRSDTLSGPLNQGAALKSLPAAA